MSNPSNLPQPSESRDELSNDDNWSRRNLNRVAGVTLMVISVLMIALMMHHPTAGGHDMHSFLEGIESIQTLNVIVHGGALIILLLLGSCMSALSSSLGTSSATVRLGAVFYAAGLLNMFAAATVSGFLVPGFAGTLAGATSEQLTAGGQILHLLREINRTCDEFGVLGMSAGIFWWSLRMCLQRQARFVGILGVIAGAGGVVGLFSGHLGATLHGVLGFVLVQGVWNVLVGVGLIRNWWKAR